MHICGAKHQERCPNTPRDTVHPAPYHPLAANSMMSSLLQSAQQKNINISKTKKDNYFKKKNAILLYFERPFK